MKTRGMGGVYRRGRIWWILYWHRGHEFFESSHSEVRADAVALLRTRHGDIGRGVPRARDAERLTFEEMAEALANDYRMNGRKSLRRAMQAVAHLREAFGSFVAADITPQRVSVYIARRLEDPERPAKPATVRNEISMLKRMFTLALKAGRVAVRPYLPVPAVSNTRTGFCELDQFERVLRLLPAHLKPVAVFAYRSGWRKGEILGLRWANVDLPSGVVRLEPGTTKNDEARTLPFRADPVLRDLLRSQRAQTSELERSEGRLVPWVFHRHGKQLSDIYTAWRRACRRAGVPELLFHDLRRSAVRNMERAGVSRSVAMRLSGHKTEAVYRRYAITNEADLAEGVRKVAELAARPPVKASAKAVSRRTGTEPVQFRAGRRGPRPTRPPKSL